MTPSIYLSSALYGIALFLFVLSVPNAVVPLARRFFYWRRRYYAVVLDRLQEFDENPSVYVGYEFLSGIAIGAMVHMVLWAPFMSLLGFSVGYLLPGFVMSKREMNRRERLEYQLPDAMTTLASSVRAGLSLPNAIGETARKMPAPLSQEFALIHREYESGMPLNDVLKSASARLASRQFNLMSSALVINRERGGDITDILERIGASLRELYRLEQKLKTETAGARLEGIIMLFVPPVVLTMFYFAQPDLVNTLFTTPIGIVIAIIATAFMVAAYYWIQKIVNEDL